MTRLNFSRQAFKLHCFKPVVGILLAGASCMTHAEGLLEEFARVREQGKSTHVLDIENDSLLLKRDDGLYTSGLRYTYLYSMGDAAQLKTYGWRIGQELYTASDIKFEPAEIPSNDHPYAAWLYAGLFKEQHRADGNFYRMGLDIGCLGPCAGGETTQDALHGILNQPKPRAWSTQLRNEWGAVLYGDYAPARFAWNDNVDIRPSVHGRFGNIFTDVAGNLTLRAGQLSQLPNQSTMHGFLRLGGRLVAYNATLQGGYFSDGGSRTVDPKGFVPEAEAGFVWNRAPFNILLSVVRRGNEIEGLSSSAGMQNFARVSISYTP
jgi:hypothetical protein